jgi:hypothetical protein
MSKTRYSRSGTKETESSTKDGVRNGFSFKRDFSGSKQANHVSGRSSSGRERAPAPREDLEHWQIQKKALQEKFKEGWNPRKKLSPDTMEGIRALHEQDPDKYSTSVLADHFKVSPEAIRRILKSKWRPSAEAMQARRERWARRHDRIWDQQAELGLRPKRIKDRAVEDPDQFEEDLRAKEMLDAARKM